jgi:hypothetical protein
MRIFAPHHVQRNLCQRCGCKLFTLSPSDHELACHAASKIVPESKSVQPEAGGSIVVDVAGAAHASRVSRAPTELGARLHLGSHQVKKSGL